MPEPRPAADLPLVRRVAWVALLAGLLLFCAKLGVFAATNSAAVLSDALESIVNLVAAGVMIYTLRLSSRPPDREHHYGHGKAEFLAVALEGAMVLTAALAIGVEAVRRLFRPAELSRLDLGVWLVAGTAAITLALGLFVWTSGRRHANEVLRADGKHLMTDAASTLSALLALLLVRATGKAWIDPVAALGMAAFILWTGAGLVRKSVDGLMDRFHPFDDAVCKGVLDEAVRTGLVRGYHKLRHRRNGGFTWVDMHIQVDPGMSVRDSHALASRIEHEIERRLESGNVTAHVEPWDEN